MSDRKKSILRSAAGFTLIELVIVMVVLAIMAGLAIPKFLDLRDDAKVSAVNGALGGVRSAVANFHAQEIAAGDPSEWPTLAELDGSDATKQAMDGKFPENPYATASPKNSLAVCATAQGVLDAAKPDTWCYLLSGEFWANSNVAGENVL